MKLTVFGEIKEVAVFTASYRDFVAVHDPNDWQEAFFHVMGWKNTLTSRFYECTIDSTPTGKAFLLVVSPAKHAEWVENCLIECGYEKIARRIEKAFIYDDPIYDNDGLDDVIGYYSD